MNILENVKIENTFKLDVVAKYFFEINNTQDVFYIFNYIKEKNYESVHGEKDLKYIILGSGSNVLFLNSFYDGLIIKSNLKSLNILQGQNRGESEAVAPERVFVKVGSGYEWDSFVKYACDNNYYGLENMSHIPGTVGAAPVQNIGAYGAEVSNFIFEIECYDIEKNIFIILKNTENKKECDFAYRDSIFKRKKYFIISVTFLLSKQKKMNLDYKDVQDYIRGDSEAVAPENLKKDLTLLEMRNIIINIRNKKMPNWRDVKSLGTAGSFFKNIIIDAAHYSDIKEKYPDIISFSYGDVYKLSSAYIIDKILNMKNYKIGDVGTYENQALIIVNHGEAAGSDIYNFSENIIKKVKNLLSLSLEREVNVVD